jgi:glyoxylase-like metal-dependent hydrolase (beta-lactamase superfamily II)
MAVPNFICNTCGTQFRHTDTPPDSCPICQDERQYVKATGQAWTTLDQLRKSHRNAVRWEEPELIGIGIEPHFGIGQRALFLRTDQGNVLWDCLPLIDQAVVECLKGLGGVAAIAISHPHYYSSMVEWSRALGGAPIYLHEADRQWVMRPDPAIQFWAGDTRSLHGLTLIHCGGHFAGGTVLHWPKGAAAKGALLSGDILQVTADRKHVSFMYSYPNFIPLPATAIQRITEVLAPFSYERVYGAFWDLVIQNDGKNAVERSAQRYLRAMDNSR